MATSTKQVPAKRRDPDMANFIYKGETGPQSPNKTGKRDRDTRTGGRATMPSSSHTDRARFDGR